MNAATYPNELTELLSRRRFGHVIDGKPEQPQADALHEVLDPTTGRAIAEIPLGTTTDVDRAVAAARSALPFWRGRTPGQRAELLLAVADLLDRNCELFAQLESLNVGKPLSVSRDEIPVASDVFRFMAGAARAVTTPGAGDYTAGHLSIIRREPVGVVGAITPWNYPLLTATWKIAAALAAGNTIVVKPSELTPLTTILLAELSSEILPAGVFNVVLGSGPQVGKPMAEHPDIDLISLTGSVASGIAVSESAARTLKRVHLELGGKAPVIVFDDADLDEVVRALRVASFVNSGQECGAATRVMCTPKIRDELVAALRTATESLRVGSPAEGEDIEIGPLVSARHREAVHGLVQRAVEAGATIVAGGTYDDDAAGFFYPPTLIVDIPAGAEILRREVFGPVVTVETFVTEEDAVALANAVDYGLAASVWTENGRRALRIVDRLDYGTVWVNDHLALATEMPWGGFGASGSGRELSVYALDDFSRTKHVMLTR